MKFILKKELNYRMSHKLVDQATCDNDLYVDIAESVALQHVREALGAIYDMDKELRSFIEFKPNKEYVFGDRVLVDPSNSGLTAEKKYFAQERGITLLGDESVSETIYVAKNNVCEPEYKTYWQSKVVFDSIRYQGQSTLDKTFNDGNLSFLVPNDEYNEECGGIIYSAATAVTGTSLAYMTDKKTNKFSVKYIPNGQSPEYIQSSCTYNQIYDVVAIDFEQEFAQSGKTPGDFIGNSDYFNQYTDDSEFSIDDRNPTLVRIVLDIMICDLLTRTGMENNLRSSRSKQALKDLQSIKKGELEIDLERTDKQDGKQSGMRIRFTNNWEGKYKNEY